MVLINEVYFKKKSSLSISLRFWKKKKKKASKQKQKRIQKCSLSLFDRKKKKNRGSGNFITTKSHNLCLLLPLNKMAHGTIRINDFLFIFTTLFVVSLDGILWGSIGFAHLRMNKIRRRLTRSHVRMHLLIKIENKVHPNYVWQPI